MMPFSNGFGDRQDDIRFRTPQSPPEEAPFPHFPAALVGSGSRMLQAPQSSDQRAALPRRFTTESARLPTLAPIGQVQRSQAGESADLSNSTMHKVQLLEKKRLEYEMLREQRRRFEAEMQLIELRQQREEQEIAEMTEALGKSHVSAGHQSEPTTPPLPTRTAHPNRYSASAMLPPPGLRSQIGPSSQVTSPPPRVYQSQVTPTKLPSKSVPGSRRNSDDMEPEEQFEEEVHPHRSAAINRNSMPAVSRGFRAQNDVDSASTLNFGQINTTGFLFGDDDSERHSVRKEHNSTTSPDVKSYLQMNATDDKFPILVRRDDHPGLLSASSAALDLALSQSPGPEAQSGGWPNFSRHRPAQHSLPANHFPLQQTSSQMNESPKFTVPKGHASTENTPRRPLHYERHSMDLNYSAFGESAQPSTATTLMPGAPRTSSPPKLQSSYSTNDVPTMKTTDRATVIGAAANTHAQQHLQNHNAGMGRIPTSGINKTGTRETAVGDRKMSNREVVAMSSQPPRSALHPNAPLFGPTMPSSSSAVQMTATATPPAISPFTPPAYYGAYGLPMMGMNLNGMHMGNQMMHPPGPYGPYHVYGFYGRGSDGQARALQQRRTTDANRYNNAQLESLRGEIYPLCKDQHGCRYLQKKLEERNPEHMQMIFLEINEHVVELMTDPFGNYLCQKLLEYANDEQRTVLVNNAAPHLSRIAFNQHGTRALQKMIEFITTREQIQTIIIALQGAVVELIQDLNGNHVIQKCLNRLTPADAQFIFDAVGRHCVTVGTHRHGCCVLQRCIDHASGAQKAQIIAQITLNVFALVQDPFGNYVVQYIFDLGEPAYTEALIQRFIGQVPALSRQKFSSNVIEKCLRTAEPSVRARLIEEILQPNELQRLLRDSFGNYVVQTAMEFADANTKARLVDSIRPLLPAIRSTPYGRRIQGKIQALDGRSGTSSGQMTPVETPSSSQFTMDASTQHHRQMSGQGHATVVNTGNGSNNASFGQPAGENNTRIAALESGVATVTVPSQHQNPASYPNPAAYANNNPLQQPMPSYGRAAQPGNGFFF